VVPGTQRGSQASEKIHLGKQLEDEQDNPKGKEAVPEKKRERYGKKGDPGSERPPKLKRR